jgi:large subunit ribosomal protein L10
MKKSEKPYFVDNLTEELKSASGYVLIDFNGLSVKLQQDLKKKLRIVAGKMVIVKNTLFKLSAEKAKSPTEITSDAVLQGPTALVMTEDDPIALLQILSKFAKESEVPQLKVGIIDGAFQNKETLIKMSNLPKKSVLQAQMIGSISAPLYGIVNALQGNLQKLIYILTEGKKARE